MDTEKFELSHIEAFAKFAPTDEEVGFSRQQRRASEGGKGWTLAPHCSDTTLVISQRAALQELQREKKEDIGKVCQES